MQACNFHEIKCLRRRRSFSNPPLLLCGSVLSAVCMVGHRVGPAYRISQSLVWREVKQAVGALHFSPLCLLNPSANKLAICRAPRVKRLSFRRLAMNHLRLLSVQVKLHTYGHRTAQRVVSRVVLNKSSTYNQLTPPPFLLFLLLKWLFFCTVKNQIVHIKWNRRK